MITRSPMPPAAFDPFGEPAEAVRVGAGESGHRGTRLAVVVFWTFALVLLAGRIYLGEQAPGRTVIVAEPTVAVAQATTLR